MLVFLVIFYLICILAISFINCKAGTRTCKRFFRKTLKNISCLSKQICLLDPLLFIPENKTSVDVLCSNSNRMSDIIYSVCEQCKYCNMELSYKQWSIVQNACLDIADLNSGCFSRDDFDNYIKALREVGYDGFLTIERECGDDPTADIEKAAEFLKTKI